ncbi:MAG: hypothetical protein ACOYM3_09815 [Terrimicrobiaceae bacterium]
MCPWLRLEQQGPLSRHRANPYSSGSTINNHSDPFNPKASKILPLSGGSFAIFRTKFQPFVAQRREGGQIVFRDLVGKAEIWLDNVKVGEKTGFASGPLTVKLPSGNAGRTLSVLIEAEGSKPAGLASSVIVEAKPQE